MCHCSNFLLPPENPNTTASSPSLTYALVILNQSLPRFAPLLWDHGKSSSTFSLFCFFFLCIDSCIHCFVRILQHRYEFVLMEVLIGCMMKCLFSSLNNNLLMFATGSYFFSTLIESIFLFLCVFCFSFLDLVL